jgi:hypothetical protein
MKQKWVFTKYSGIILHRFQCVHQLSDLTAQDTRESSSFDTADCIFDIVCVLIAIVQAVRTNNSPKVLLETRH